MHLLEYSGSRRKEDIPRITHCHIAEGTSPTQCVNELRVCTQSDCNPRRGYTDLHKRNKNCVYLLPALVQNSTYLHT